MEPEKIAKFYHILRTYKSRITKRTHENESYREVKVYNFCVEFIEILDLFWLLIQRVFENFIRPARTLQLSYDRIISKVAFCPPRDTYVFNFDIDPANQTERSKSNEQSDYGELLLTQFATTVNSRAIRSYREKFSQIVPFLECFYAFNSFGNRIACIFIRCPFYSSYDASQKTIIYSHTNAEDIGSMISYLWRLRKKLRHNVFAYDYSGFGMSSGSASERNLYADVEAAVGELCKRKRLQPQDLILFGESIGSVPTIYMASKMTAYGVILQSAFMSGIRIYLPYAGKTLQYDPFPSVERVPKIKSKTLVVHGTRDMLVDVTHAVSIYRLLQNPVTPFFVKGAAHMNIHKHDYYYERLMYFVDVECAN